MQMPKEQRNALIRDGAHWFAEQRYKLDHPGCTEEDAKRFSSRHWREFVQQVIEWMALCDGVDEAEAAAPWN